MCHCSVQLCKWKFPFEVTGIDPDPAFFIKAKNFFKRLRMTLLHADPFTLHADSPSFLRGLFVPFAHVVCPAVLDPREHTVPHPEPRAVLQVVHVEIRTSRAHRLLRFRVEIVVLHPVPHCHGRLCIYRKRDNIAWIASVVIVAATMVCHVSRIKLRILSPPLTFPVIAQGNARPPYKSLRFPRRLLLLIQNLVLLQC